MVVGIKDIVKMAAISVVSLCAVFVCALFVNYGIDIASVEALITTPEAQMMYDTQIATSKVIVGASGGSLAFTSVILLIFYIKNYIDSHGKELGILKALGYSEISIACRLWVFALSVFVGTSLSYAVASVYMPRLYELQNNLSLFPEFSPKFHFEVLVILVILPTVFFALISIFYAFVKLKMPAVNMLKGIEKQPKKVKKVKVDDFSFLKDMKRNTLRSRKILAFFAGFSAFCFSAMLQMSASMGEYASDEMGFIVLLIGLTLAFVTLYLSLSSVVKANQKTIAMMKVIGYSQKECADSVINCYRPIAAVGFVIGSLYQYLLMNTMVNVVFSDLLGVKPKYSFDWNSFWITLVLFVVIYEGAMMFFSHQIKNQSVKSVMQE